ncbi:hypothetical protein QUF64_05180 [Anaerolineales bacterium HSG6]|nr:hypothetical protein [Anaerolineales bacterium HSG6]
MASHILTQSPRYKITAILLMTLLLLSIAMTIGIVSQGWTETIPIDDTTLPDETVMQIIFPSATELARRLGVDAKTYHKKTKGYIKGDFRKESQKIGTTNPDIGFNEAGNIVLRNPKTGKTIETDVPLDSYKGAE